MKSVLIRQGDVYLIGIDKIPTGVRPKDRVVALGEVTGHKHQFNSQAEVFIKDGTQFVNAGTGCVLLHDEHAQLEIPTGKYEVIIQREFDIVQGVRQVMD